jgi:hypothetical protein
MEHDQEYSIGACFAARHRGDLTGGVHIIVAELVQHTDAGDIYEEQEETGTKGVIGGTSGLRKTGSDNPSLALLYRTTPASGYAWTGEGWFLENLILGTRTGACHAGNEEPGGSTSPGPPTFLK